MLTPKQLAILRRLAQGQGYHSVCESLQISLPCIYVHAQRIRARTGIKNTKDARQCAAWLDAHADIRRRALLPVVPTPGQLRIMELFALGKGHEQIARELGIGPATVASQLSAARLRAGLPGAPGLDRVKQVREYLATHGITPEPPASKNVSDY